MLIYLVTLCLTASSYVERLEKVSLLIASTKGSRVKFSPRDDKIRVLVENILSDAPKELLGLKKTFVRLTRLYSFHSLICYAFLNAVMEISNSSMKPRDKIAASEDAKRKFQETTLLNDRRQFSLTHAVVASIARTEQSRQHWMKCAKDFSTSDTVFVDAVQNFKFKYMRDGCQSIIIPYNAVSQAGNAATEAFQKILRENVRDWAQQQTDLSLRDSLAKEHKRVTLKIFEIFASIKKGSVLQKMDVTLIFVFVRWLGIILCNFGNPEIVSNSIVEFLQRMRDFSERYQRSFDSRNSMTVDLRESLFAELVDVMKIFLKLRSLNRYE